MSVVCYIAVYRIVSEGRRRVMGDGVAAKVSTAANSKKENYIIIVDERKIKVCCA